MSSTLAEIFRRHAPVVDMPVFDDACLERALTDGLARARAAWPAVWIESEVFVAYVAQRVEPHHARDVLDRDYPGLYLACSAAAGTPAALRAFTEVFGRDIEAAPVHLGLRGLAASDFQQRVLEHLFVGRRRILSFSGRGSLRRWVRLTAGRLAIDLRRGNHEPQPQTLDHGARLDQLDDESEVVGTMYRSAANQAFRHALRDLSPRERNLLRFRYVHGVAVKDLARSRGVHRVTMSRELTRIRTSILTRVRSRLVEEFHVAPHETDSVVRLLQSHLDLNLSSALGSTSI